MHELMACAASLIILTLFVSQAAASTNMFIEAAYCERVISEYAEKEFAPEEVDKGMSKLKNELEKMQGVEADISCDKLEVYIDGVIGPADALGIDDNRIRIEKELELKVKEEEDEQFNGNDGDNADTGASDQITDGSGNDDDLSNIDKV